MKIPSFGECRTFARGEGKKKKLEEEKSFFFFIFGSSKSFNIKNVVSETTVNIYDFVHLLYRRFVCVA